MMNILTYASPVAVSLDRMWSIGLYKGTMSYENFAREGRGVLQMLRPEHAACAGADGGLGGLNGLWGDRWGGTSTRPPRARGWGTPGRASHRRTGTGRFDRAVTCSWLRLFVIDQPRGARAKIIFSKICDPAVRCSFCDTVVKTFFFTVSDLRVCDLAVQCSL